MSTRSFKTRTIISASYPCGYQSISGIQKGFFFKKKRIIEIAGKIRRKQPPQTAKRKKEKGSMPKK